MPDANNEHKGTGGELQTGMPANVTFEGVPAPVDTKKPIVVAHHCADRGGLRSMEAARKSLRIAVRYSLSTAKLISRNASRSTGSAWIRRDGFSKERWINYRVIHFSECLCMPLQVGQW